MGKKKRLNLKQLADMCDSEEEKQITESIVGIDDVSGEPIDPQSHRKSAAGRIQRTQSLSSCSTKNR